MKCIVLVLALFSTTLMAAPLDEAIQGRKRINFKKLEIQKIKEELQANFIVLFSDKKVCDRKDFNTIVYELGLFVGEGVDFEFGQNISGFNKKCPAKFKQAMGEIDAMAAAGLQNAIKMGDEAVD